LRKNGVARTDTVYLPTSNGINVYDASSAGKLTSIGGSPFKQTSGLFIGTIGKFVITLGTYYVHSYEVSSTSAVGKQVSEINTQAYSGVACSTTGGAVLDHSGQYIYVNLCSAIQTYEISSKGILTFKGGVVLSTENYSSPIVAGNDKFALGFQAVPDLAAMAASFIPSTHTLAKAPVC